MLKRVFTASALLMVLAFFLALPAEEAVLQQALGVRAEDGDTIVVEFPDGNRGKVRYESINAPRLDQCFGPDAQQCNEQLIKRKELWLELNPTDDGYEEIQDRLLAHVFLTPQRTQTSSVEVRLVAQGCARVDVVGPNDDRISRGEDFDVRYIDWIIAAQIEAAKTWRGWWRECDDYLESEVVIAAIKQWSEDEVVYIVNRGDEPIDLAAGWVLRDETGCKRNTLDLSEELARECPLPPGGLLRVHSGSIATGRGGEHTPCEEPEIDFYWTGHHIWDNGSDEAWLYRPNGSVAYYLLLPTGLGLMAA